MNPFSDMADRVVKALTKAKPPALTSALERAKAKAATGEEMTEEEFKAYDAWTSAEQAKNFDNQLQPAPRIMAAEQTVEGSGIDKTLAERGSRYGSFVDNSRVFADLMGTFRNSPAWKEGHIDMVHEHALSNIATKLARLLTGDPNYDDNWRDIAGYATLMVRICNGEKA